MFKGKEKPGDFANPTLSGRVCLDLLAVDTLLNYAHFGRRASFDMSLPYFFAVTVFCAQVAQLYKYIHGQMDTPAPKSKSDATKPAGDVVMMDAGLRRPLQNICPYCGCVDLGSTAKLGSRLQHLEDGSNPVRVVRIGVLCSCCTLSPANRYRGSE